LFTTVGFLIDSYVVPAWQRAIIDCVLKSPAMQVGLVVTNSGNKQPTENRLTYRILRKADRMVFKTKHNHFATGDISELLANIPVRQIHPKQTRFKDEFLEEDITWIRQQKPDILIRFGFRILTGEILKVAKHGVWSLHHGDSAVNRGGPPAFWEVFNREPITGVTLQVLSEKLDAGQVLGKAYGKTDTTSFNRNQQSAYAAGIELFCGRLNDFSILGPEKFFQTLPGTQEQLFAKTLYRDPQNFKALQIAIVFWWRRVIQFLDKLLFIRQWVIYYHKQAEHPYGFKNATLLASTEQTDWADPFLYRHGGHDYLFFEYLKHGSPHGDIRCLRMDQLTHTPMRVLEEPYHLSYPTITEVNGKLYLLVESGAGKTVCLYECVAFPHQWKKLKPILDNIELYDPTLYFHDGRWYLFGTHRSIPGASTDMYLHIYYTDDLLSSDWQPHPLNPLTRDVRGSRPAGKIFNVNGKLIRPAQIGTPRYGFGTRFFEIVKLSPTEYQEQLLEGVVDILPWQRNMVATHTYSANQGTFVVDAQVRRFRFF
jgi:folate-dependent phosphoribosylglycinamide formyltransferase PurN